MEMETFKKSFPQKKSVVSVISHKSQQPAETNNTRMSYSIDQKGYCLPSSTLLNIYTATAPTESAALPKRKVPLLPKIHSTENKGSTQTTTSSEPSEDKKDSSSEGSDIGRSPVFATHCD